MEKMKHKGKNYSLKLQKKLFLQQNLIFIIGKEFSKLLHNTRFLVETKQERGTF
jgi:hypothetical protein